MQIDNAPKAQGIYLIRNLINGRGYFGQAVNIRKRLYHHRWSLNAGRHSNRPLQSAWKKYGPDAFKWDVICICREVEFLNVVERELLSGRARVSGVGEIYNLAKEPGAVMTGRKHSADAKKKMSERRSAFRYTKDQKAKICEIQRRRQLARPGYADRVQGFFDAVRGGVDTLAALKINGFERKPETADRLYRQYGDIFNGNR